MDPQAVMAVLEQTGTLRKGHFLLTSGRHSDRFLLCAQVMQHPQHLGPLCAAMVAPFQGQGIETVAGPAMGGVLLSYECARALGARAVYAEKDGQGGMVMRRGFHIRPGEPVLVVEDAVTTGGSVFRTLEAVRAAGAKVAGVAIMVDRSGGTVDFGAPLHALVSMQVDSWTAEDCPLCRQGVPLVEPKK